MLALSVMPMRATFRTKGDVYLTNPATALRGAFGYALREVVCEKQCVASNACPKGHGVCFSARFFDATLTPEESAKAPSGFRQDPPRPFVLRSSLVPGLTARGKIWELDLYCFDTQNIEPLVLIKALELLGANGLGNERTSSTIERITGLDAGFQSISSFLPVVLPLPLPNPGPVERFAIEFITPTELIVGGTPASRPEFPILVRALVNRLQPLCHFYGAGTVTKPEMEEFLLFTQGADSKLVSMTWPENRRTSTRTFQKHPLSGFLGVMEYMASMQSYVCWLEAGLWTGVGKHTQFGHGQYRLMGPPIPK